MVSSPGKREIPSTACRARSARSKLVCANRRAPATTESKNALKVSTGSMALGEVKRNGRLLAQRFPITHLPQKFEKHHKPTKRGHRSLGLAQFHFFSPQRAVIFQCTVLSSSEFLSSN